MKIGSSFIPLIYTRLLNVGGDSKAQLVSMGELAAAERRDSQTMVYSDPVAVAQRLLMGSMEDVIAEMAGYVPLSAIGERILTEFADDCFGDFRGSLVGLLAAYNYELSILQVRSRIGLSMSCQLHAFPDALTRKMATYASFAAR